LANESLLEDMDNVEDDEVRFRGVVSSSQLLSTSSATAVASTLVIFSSSKYSDTYYYCRQSVVLVFDRGLW
jgi:hypothetical protein